MPYVNPTTPTSTDAPLVVISNNLINDEGCATAVDVNPDLGLTLEDALASIAPHGAQLALPDVDIESAASAADATILFADGYVGRPNARAADAIACAMATSTTLNNCTLRPPIVLEHVIEGQPLDYDVTDAIYAMPYESLIDYPTTERRKDEFIETLEHWARNLGYVDAPSDTLSCYAFSWDSYAVAVDERARAVATCTDTHDRVAALTRAAKHAQDMRIAAVLEVERMFDRNITHVNKLINELETDLR